MNQGTLPPRGPYGATVQHAQFHKLYCTISATSSTADRSILVASAER